jgi:hypothetical protein
MLFNDELIKIKIKADELQKMNALDLFKSCIKSLGFDKKGVLVDNMMSHALYANTEEEHYQGPHTDYTYPAPKSRTVDISGYHLTWTTSVPTNIEGSFLNVWEKTGYPMNMCIKYGEIFFF